MFIIFSDNKSLLRTNTNTAVISDNRKTLLNQESRIFNNCKLACYWEEFKSVSLRNKPSFNSSLCLGNPGFLGFLERLESMEFYTLKTKFLEKSTRYPKENKSPDKNRTLPFVPQLHTPQIWKVNPWPWFGIILTSTCMQMHIIFISIFNLIYRWEDKWSSASCKWKKWHKRIGCAAYGASYCTHGKDQMYYLTLQKRTNIQMWRTNQKMSQYQRKK